jgi:ankyrin repeat protein
MDPGKYRSAGGEGQSKPPWPLAGWNRPDGVGKANHHPAATLPVQTLTIAALLLLALSASALDRVEARPGGNTMSGRMSGATEFQFGVQVRGNLEQKIEQMERELRLLHFARDDFPALSKTISYSGTNRLMSQGLADLSKIVGKQIPMDLGSNNFTAKEFVFVKIPLVDALKYLVAFDDAILDVSGAKLVCKPVRQALALDETEYKLVRLMKTQHFKEAEAILASGNLNIRKVKDEDEHTLLHLAAWRNQTSIAKRLIDMGAEVNAKDNVGYTPLHEAVRDGHQEFADLMLKNGADTSITDNNNSTPLQTAIYFGFPDIANLLVSRGAKVDIYIAAGLGMADQVKKMLDEGVDYQKEQREYLDRQLANGPQIFGIGHPIHKAPGSYLTIHNVSPLHWAARGGSAEVVSLLVSRGESVSLQDSNGETPLFWAVASGKVKAAETLLKNGANVNATNAFGSTPLLTSARDTESPELMKLLIQAGAGVNARDSQGENALHKLAWFGYPQSNVETAQLLLDAGADITARNKEGKTPLEVLLDNSMRNSDLVKLYRKYADKAAAKKR